VPVNCQMARIDATTATTMQNAVVQNANRRTTRGFRKPFCCGRGDPCGVLIGEVGAALLFVDEVSQGPCRAPAGYGLPVSRGGMGSPLATASATAFSYARSPLSAYFTAPFPSWHAYS